ncbi:MAG: TGS domain-containing protein, partial [Croceimicrobium sp.]
MIKITLPDGSIKEVPEGSSALDVAKSISHGLARNVLSATFNGTTVEAQDPLPGDGALQLHTWESPEGKTAFWHSSAHLLAQTLEQLYPGIKLTIGPAIENGFYYDVDFNGHEFGEGDFDKVEKTMLDNARQKSEFQLHPVSKAKALELYKDNEFKTELIENLEDGTITFCDHAEFTDLCRGGH